MVLQNHNMVAALSGSSTLSYSTSSHSFNNSSGSNPSGATTTSSTAAAATMTGHQRPIVDLLVAMIAVPILIFCALHLEKNLNDMANSPESRWLVFALGIGMLIVSVIICGYVTHRMGVCIWAGPIDEMGNRTNGVPHINSQNDILRIVDAMPPSYDSVVKFDIPPPPYDCLVIDMEQSKQAPAGTGKEESPTAATVMHI